MNIIADLNNRSLACYAPFILREKADVQAVRADGTVWTAALNYRVCVFRGATVLAYCTLTRDALGRTLYGTLDANTTEAIAAFTAAGNPGTLPIIAAIVDIDAVGVVLNIYGQSAHEMAYNPIDVGSAALSANSLSYGQATITNGTSSGTVTYGVTFALAPAVTATVQCPTGGDVLTVVVTAGVASFAYTLSGTAASAGYKLNWIAAKL